MKLWHWIKNKLREIFGCRKLGHDWATATRDGLPLFRVCNVCLKREQFQIHKRHQHMGQFLEAPKEQ